MQRKPELKNSSSSFLRRGDPIRKAKIVRYKRIVCYNKNAVSVCEEAQRVDRETRQRLRKEEIARYSLAPCHHNYA